MHYIYIDSSISYAKEVTCIYNGEALMVSIKRKHCVRTIQLHYLRFWSLLNSIKITLKIANRS